MPNRDGTGPRGAGPKKNNRGVPTPKRSGRGPGRGRGPRKSGRK